MPLFNFGQNDVATIEQNCEAYIEEPLMYANNLVPLTWLINNFSDYNYSEKCIEYINDMNELYWEGVLLKMILIINGMN